MKQGGLREVCYTVRFKANSIVSVPLWPAQDTAKVILKSGKSESISIMVSVVRVLIANDGVWYRLTAQEGQALFTVWLDQKRRHLYKRIYSHIYSGT